MGTGGPGGLLLGSPGGTLDISSDDGELVLEHRGRHVGPSNISSRVVRPFPAPLGGVHMCQQCPWWGVGGWIVGCWYYLCKVNRPTPRFPGEA